MTNQKTITLGSLFDGIGGFPLAAMRNGILPVWASEIEPFPIQVTQLRFPNMLQVGDITKLKGDALPPVDIISGGSPCQDLSIAGKRAGMKGERSGLFMEQIRIVKEMRDASGRKNGAAKPVQPRYMLWENVPGAFSSTGGKDFHAVLEETVRIADSSLYVPGPPGWAWKPAGAILGDGFSVAWRVLDARYWGVPQRRRRIYLVADFAGRSAPQILFEQDRLFGHPAQGESARQGASPAAQAGAGNTSGDRLTSWDLQNRQIDNAASGEGIALYSSNEWVAFACNQRDEVRDLHGVSGALSAQPGMKQQTFVAGFNAGAAPSSGIGYGTELAPTLKSGSSGTSQVPSVLCLNDQGGAFMDVNQDISGTLREQEHGHPPIIYENHGKDTGGNNLPLVQQGVLCISGNILDRKPENGGNGFGVQQDVSYTLTSCDRHAVFTQQRSDQYTENILCSTQSTRQCKDKTDLVLETAGLDLRNLRENGGISGTLQAKPNGGYSLNTTHPIRIGQLIRRLTPLECERLQGFPDGWTAISGASDSARYKALGNSVAIPCVEFVMRGLAYFLSLGQKGG